jgi:Flp pilus assembly protein protease CpaA
MVFMEIFFLSVQTVTLTFLSFQDLKYKAVSLWVLVLLVGISVSYVYVNALNPPWDFILLLGLLFVIIKAVFLLGPRQNVIGLGDVILIPTLCLGLQAAEIIWFISIAGFAGIGFAKAWQLLFQEQSFPFVPVLTLAYGATLLIRLAS